MSRLRFLSRLVPVLAAGLALVLLSLPSPAEAGPRHGNGHSSRSVKPPQHRSQEHDCAQQDRGRHPGIGGDQHGRHDAGRRERGHDARRAPRYRAVAPPACPPVRGWCGNELRVVSPAPNPWWEGAPRVYVHGNPFFFNAGLGVYLGGLGLMFLVGDLPPAGYCYVDPYCGTRFDSLDCYRAHARFQGHDAVVDLVARGD